MIQIKVGTLQKPQFVGLLRKLFNSSEYPSLESSMKAANLVKQLELEWKEVVEEHDLLLKEYALRDEKGEFVQPQPGAYKIDELKVPEYNEKVNALNN